MNAKKYAIAAAIAAATAATGGASYVANDAQSELARHKTLYIHMLKRMEGNRQEIIQLKKAMATGSYWRSKTQQEKLKNHGLK